MFRNPASRISSNIIIIIINSAFTFLLLLLLLTLLRHNSDHNQKMSFYYLYFCSNSNSCNTNNNSIICSLPRIEHHGNHCRTNISTEPSSLCCWWSTGGMPADGRTDGGRNEMKSFKRVRATTRRRKQKRYNSLWEDSTVKRGSVKKKQWTGVRSPLSTDCKLTTVSSLSSLSSSTNKEGRHTYTATTILVCIIYEIYITSIIVHPHE